MSGYARLDDDEDIVIRPRGAAMSDMTMYVLSLDQAALGLCFLTMLGVIGWLAFGAMRGDIARARPEPAPIDHVAAVTRQAIEAVARYAAHRQPLSM